MHDCLKKSFNLKIIPLLLNNDYKSAVSFACKKNDSSVFMLSGYCLGLLCSINLRYLYAVCRLTEASLANSATVNSCALYRA